MSRAGIRPVLAVLAAVAAAVAVTAFVLPHRSGADRPVSAPVGEYVALGDSYAAGPGIPALTGTPAGCGRSTHNYPSQVYARLHPTAFRDVTCGGATTSSMTEPQQVAGGTNPAQLTALDGATAVVTLTVGGNDIGFSEIVSRCLSRTPSAPAGAPCRDHYRRSGRDVLADRIVALQPRLSAVLAEVRQRAPAAKVLVVGYPTILPTSGLGCPQAPVSTGDITYLDQTFQALNAMIRSRAQASGARFVDTAESSAGHDVCAADRWVEGREPTLPAAAFHPNEQGMRQVAERVLDELRGPL